MAGRPRLARYALGATRLAALRLAARHDLLPVGRSAAPASWSTPDRAHLLATATVDWLHAHGLVTYAWNADGPRACITSEGRHALRLAERDLMNAELERRRKKDLA